jgi:hypothetical protein
MRLPRAPYPDGAVVGEHSQEIGAKSQDVIATDTLFVARRRDPYKNHDFATIPAASPPGFFIRAPWHYVAASSGPCEKA